MARSRSRRSFTDEFKAGAVQACLGIPRSAGRRCSRQQGTPAGRFATKYLHSILRRDEKRFEHLDGAIKTYTPSAYADAYAKPEVKAGV